MAALRETTPAAPDIPAGSPAAAGMSGVRLGRIDEILNRHVAAGEITGAVATFARGGKVIHTGSYGYADPVTGAPMHEAALFQSYSSTKVALAVAVLMMVEEGRLRLEDPVSAHLPEFQRAQVAVRKPGDHGSFQPRSASEPPPPHDRVPAERDITLRDLMTHTSGLMSSDPRRVGMTAPRRAAGETLLQYARRVGPTPLDHQPGSRWSYSPTVGSDVLAGLVELATDETFDTVLRRRIFEPLGMVDTFYVVPPAKRDRLLPVYRRVGDEWRRTLPALTTEAAALDGSNPPAGAMGLVTTARDLLLLQQMLLDKGRSLSGEALLGSRTVELMGSNLVGDLYRGEGAYAAPMHGHGFGLLNQVVVDRLNGDTGRSNGAFGWGGYLGTMNWTDPAEGIAAVIMLQQNNRKVHIDYEHAIRQAIID